MSDMSSPAPDVAPTKNPPNAAAARTTAPAEPLSTKRWFAVTTAVGIAFGICLGLWIRSIWSEEGCSVGFFSEALALFYLTYLVLVGMAVLALLMVISARTRRAGQTLLLGGLSTAVTFGPAAAYGLC